MFDHLRRLFAPPIFPDEEKTRISQFLISFSWAAICAILLLVLSRLVIWTGGSTVATLILVVTILLLFFIQYIVRLGFVRAASILLVCGLWILVTSLAVTADGIRDAAILAYVAVIILSSLLLGWRVATVVGGLSLVAIWYLAIMEQLGARILEVDDPISYASDLSAIIILVGILVYLLISNWSRSLQSARIELRERLRAEEKLQRQTDYLSAVNEISLGLLNRLQLRSLLESILLRACHLLDAKHGLIELVLPDGSALRQEVGYGSFAQYIGMLTQKDQGLVGSVWSRDEVIIVQDYASWGKSLPEGIEAGYKAVMGLPLKVGKVVIGVLVIAYTEVGRTFTEEQVSMLTRFAALAALAIDSARLYEMAQTELQERRNTESALRTSEERFRKVFNNSYIAIAIVTLEEGRFLEANPAFWKLSGFTPEEALGRTSLEMNTWDDPADRSKFVRELLEKRSLQNVHVEFKRKNQPDRISIAFYELFHIEDQPCILCMFYDVTEQRQIEHALQENEKRMRAILDAIPDMIFEISNDGTFLDFMASADLTPVMLPSQFIGKNVKEMFPLSIADQTLFALERALATGQLHAFEYGLPPGEETQFFEARISAISPRSAIMMVRDISQRKWVETEREQLINELEGKNSELERFTYTVSHDLKSPLITIKGFLGFLEQDAVSGNLVRLKADIQRIASATDKMQLLLNELLELTRIGRLVNPPQSVDFGELVREAVELVQGQIQRKGIQVSIQEDLPVVCGDRRRLVEVLQNLIDNAAKFMGDQLAPRIEIGMDGYELGLPIFYVRDNGIGIEVLHHDRIFGLFNKLDASSDGTGIGLSLVKRIVEIHGGRIWVQSDVGKGATFFFTLRVEPAS